MPKKGLARLANHYIVLLAHGVQFEQKGTNIMKTFKELEFLTEQAKTVFKADMAKINQQIKAKMEWQDFAERCDLITARIDRIKAYNVEIHQIFHG